MTLIVSISGIRGTIGGKTGENLTPEDVMRFAKAYGKYIRFQSGKVNPTVVIGRDARISGKIVENIVTATLSALGIHICCLGLSTTPTTELAVTHNKADGGIIITASHNPENWNALKLLNSKGEFLTQEEGRELDKFLQEETTEYAQTEKIGNISYCTNFTDEHVEQILALPLVSVEAIRKAHFTVVADVINSVGALALPPLFKALGVENFILLNSTTDGRFAHNAEPLPAHLRDLSAAVVKHNATLGIAVDPDVDRLALVMENGDMFGEEYTLVAVADYVLQNTKGNTVSNLSSTQALKVITEKYGMKYSSAAVGEVNVVMKMKETNAVIGGEGNGGVIYPELHYGRDALAGIALFLTHLAKSGLSMTQLRKKYPDYCISKQKIELHSTQVKFSDIKTEIRNKFHDAEFNEEDGLKIIFPNQEWVHLRTSNTEPIIRIYAESTNSESSERLAATIKKEIEGMIYA